MQTKLFQNEEEEDRKVQQEGILPATAVLCTFYQRHGMSRHDERNNFGLPPTYSKNSKLRHGHVKA
jgi:hypothetical protein